jgi:phytoene desaturase (3,4-didehydrolycopene-forming)
VEVGKRLGVEYRLNTPVSKIRLSLDGLKAIGVDLESGESLIADIVVNNSDLVYAYNNLLPASPYAQALLDRPTSCSSISFYWGLSRQVPELEAHNIFLADEYKESFDNIFKKHLIPDEPSFYVNVPSRVDASAAPKGKDSVVVLVPVGHLIESTSTRSASSSITNGSLSTNGDIKLNSQGIQKAIAPIEHQDWPAMIKLARNTIISTIKARTGADLAPLIQTELTNDPTSWKQRFNLDKGAILGLSHSFFNVLCFRPNTRARRPGRLDAKVGGGPLGTVSRVLEDAVRPQGSKHIQGLYLVGASTHPGTGVPICLAGGRLVSEQILDDNGINVPWRRAPRAQLKSKLDVLDRPLWMELGEWWLWLFVLLALLPLLNVWLRVIKL